MVSYIGYKAEGLGFDAHLTVCYFGKDNPEEEYIREAVASLSPDFDMAIVKRVGIDLFGPDNDIPVLRVKVPDLLQVVRKKFQDVSVSQFTEWNPHITLSFEDHVLLTLPPSITVSNLGVY